MATQPIQKSGEDGAPTSNDATWKILAKEAAEEKDPEKLMKIVDALTRALDEKEARKKSA